MNKTFKKIAYQLHLWLGAISGLIVFIICITGAIWAIDLNHWSDSPNIIKIEAQEGEQLLAPSQLLTLAEESLQGNMPSSISYTKGEASQLKVGARMASIAVSMNPYTGEIIKVDNNNDVNGEYKTTFWDFIRDGHRALWLPWDIGRPIVNYCALIFLITLITGIIIWFPKSKKGFKNRLTFNWRKGTKANRKIYDLHLVIGFYASFLLILLCATGMMWGVSWWSSGWYKLTTGDELPKRQRVIENTVEVPLDTIQFHLSANIDKVFGNAIAQSDDAQTITISLPNSKSTKATIGLRVSYDNKVRYNYDSYAFNPHTLEEVKQKGFSYGRYADKSFGEKLRRQNYDLHVGAIGGNVGGSIMILAAIFGASLPISGYYVLFKVKRRKKRKER